MKYLWDNNQFIQNLHPYKLNSHPYLRHAIWNKHKRNRSAYGSHCIKGCLAWKGKNAMEYVNENVIYYWKWLRNEFDWSCGEYGKYALKSNLTTVNTIGIRKTHQIMCCFLTFQMYFVSITFCLLFFSLILFDSAYRCFSGLVFYYSFPFFAAGRDYSYFDLFEWWKP